MPNIGSAEIAILAVVMLPLMLIPIFLGYCTGRIFQKAGRPLWEGFVPLYNWYVWILLVGRPTWWIILLFIPLVNVVVQVFLAIDMARSFGKDEVFGVLMLWLLAIIGVPMLAFGNDQYLGPSVVNPNSLIQQ